MSATRPPSLARLAYDDVLAMLDGVAETATGATALCPAHDDTRSSLSVSTGDDGRVLLHCHAGCDFGAILSALGIAASKLMPARFDAHNGNGHHAKSNGKKSRGEIVATYDYRNETGVVLYQVCRMNPKDFRQRKPDGNGGWEWKIKGVRQVPYRLPELVGNPESPVLIVEGEKDVDRLSQLGFLATTNAGGAGKWKDTPDFTQPFRGRHVATIPDNDAAGRQHAHAVALQLSAVTASVRIVELPGLPPKGDVSDWFDAGGTVEQLRELMGAAAVFDPATAAEAKPGNERRKPSEPITVLEADDDPHRLARLFLASKHTTRAGIRSLVFWQGEFLAWRQGAWRPITPAELKSDLTHCIKAEFDRLNIVAQEMGADDGDDGPPKAKKVTRAVVENAMLALQSLVILAGHVRQPSWLGVVPAGYPAAELLVTQSGILHLPSVGMGRDCLLPLTPNLFTPTALDYGYDPTAPCGEWLKFLESLWPTDAESIRMLQEFFGLLLTSNTTFHKLLLIIGPARSGKGTIGRIAKQLLGELNVASPTLGSLAEQFGLASLIGKTMALVADARLSGRADAVAVVERLLSITGEDPQDVQRKHLPTLAAMRLLARFVILANELPRLQDAAGALLSRVLLLKTTRSFVGREDRGLEPRLMAELPGILNWSIKGWQRLMARGRFEQPKSGQELIDDLEELSSPITQFIRERCIVGPEFDVAIADLFAEWKKWCEVNGRDKPGNQQTFGRDIRAAQPQLAVRRTKQDGERERHYLGIGIRGAGPHRSADFVIAREAKSQNVLGVKSDSAIETRERNGEVRGPSRTQIDPPAVDSPAADDAEPPRNVRADAPKYPPWITKAAEGVA